MAKSHMNMDTDTETDAYTVIERKMYMDMKREMDTDTGTDMHVDTDRCMDIDMYKMLRLLTNHVGTRGK
jgi:hypothetical protein